MADSPHPDSPRDTLSRRTFLKSAGGVAAGGVLTGGLAETVAGAVPASERAVPTVSGEVDALLLIDGAKRKFRAEPRTTLLSALRNRLDPPMTGTKEVCDMGDCGACTVMVDGRPAYACLLLALDLTGREIRTVEGLGTPEAMSPVQEAFCEHDALMCGFCTPGFVVATTACLEQNPGAGMDEIKVKLSGNLCRCGTYPHIFDAAETARAALKNAKGGR